MTDARLRVLLVEDNPDDAELVRHGLARSASEGVRVEVADTLAGALARVGDEPFDVVLLDLGLPDSRRLQGFERIQEAAPEVPVVVLSGDADRDTAIEAVRLGAQDYLVKDRADGEVLIRTLRYAVERKRITLALEAATRDLRDLVEHAPFACHTTDATGLIVEINRTELGWLGYRKEDVVDRMRMTQILSPGSARFIEDLQSVLLHKGFLRTLDVELACKDGTLLPALASLTALSNARGEFLRTRWTLVNVAWQRDAVIERDRLLRELDDARRYVDRLMGALPICSSCRRIQDQQGFWVQLDRFLEEHDIMGPFAVRCPDCGGKGEPSAPYR